MSNPLSDVIFIRLLVTSLILTYLLSLRKAHHLSRMTWEQLLLRLQPVDSHGLSVLVHGLYLNNNVSARANFDRLYREIGGAEGVRRMRQNAEVMVMLAAYTEAWSPDISAATVRQMRDDGYRLRRAAWKISFALCCAQPGMRMLCWTQELSSCYFGMVHQLLTLYATVHIARYSPLRAACGVL